MNGFEMQCKKLTLFVWDGPNVLTDYKSGLICVLAEDLEQALKLINKKCPSTRGNFPVSDVKVIEKPEAFVCWGSS